MALKKSIVIAGLLALGLGATAVVAADMNAIQARQACMKANGKMMGALVPMFKGEKPFDAAALKEAMSPMNAACADWANFWGEDTKPGGATETWAKEEVWTDAAGFKAAGEAAYAADLKLAAVTDEAGFKAAFQEVGGSCKGCHDKFRKPKDS